MHICVNVDVTLQLLVYRYDPRREKKKKKKKKKKTFFFLFNVFLFFFFFFFFFFFGFFFLVFFVFFVFGLGENKGADQLRSNCESDQRLCFCYTDSTIPLLSKSKISTLYSSSVLVQLGLCQTSSETRRPVFSHPGSYYSNSESFRKKIII